MGKLLLIIDDDPVERAILERPLVAGCRVMTAADGLGGLDAAESARPDLVLRTS